MTNQLLFKEASKKHSYLLLFLLLLFCFRVGAQLLQLFYPVSFLPSFEAWHSGALPYWVLLTFQVFIIIFCVGITYQFATGAAHPNQRIGKLCLVFGVVYFSLMLFRLVAGLTFAFSLIFSLVPLGILPTFSKAESTASSTSRKHSNLYWSVQNREISGLSYRSIMGSS